MDKVLVMEKSKSPEYMPVGASSEDGNEDDSLMNYRWNPSKSPPLTPYIQYEKKFLQKMGGHENSIMGPPSPEVDAKWEELTQFFFTEFPYEEMKKLGREKEAIQLPNGNFIVVYAVNHLLHCLKRVHHSQYPDHYFPNMTEHQKIEAKQHDMHCFEDLIQQAMCHGDTAPYTTLWHKKDPRPTGRSDIAHECVNWDMLTAELKRKHVDPWEPGLLIHPEFGKPADCTTISHSELREIVAMQALS
ncbi:hypothetical protein E4U21_007770 [Claviceps maximensis]|nr:hypothetical protein E4U21_007770 [Claviceps maximensis]